MNIKIELNKDDYSKIIRSLRDVEKSEESVLKTAVNNTAKRAQRLLIKRAGKTYVGEVARQDRIKSASEIIKGQVKNPTAVIRFSSTVHEIKEFHVSSLVATRTLQGNVLKGASKALEGTSGKAFVVRFKSGHQAVVQRVPGSKMKSNPTKEKLKKLLGPSYMKMIGGDKVYKPDEVSELLHNEIGKIMSRVLGGGK